MALTKKLTPMGNSMGILIDRPVLDLLGIDRDTTLEIRTDGRAIIIEPVGEQHIERVRATARRVMRAQRETLKKLAG